MDRQHPNPGDVLPEEFMRPLGISTRALGAAIDVSGNRVSDIVRGTREMTEDEDIDAPTVEELKMLATLLWDANQRKRLKGKKGEALRELSEIRAQIVNGSLSATERVRLGNRLWALNGTSFSGPGPLGVGQFVWRPNRRPKGAPSKTVDAELDYRLIQRAKDLLPLKKTVGAALRAAIEEVREGGKLVYVETESQIKRLRRKARRLGLLTG